MKKLILILLIPFISHVFLLAQTGNGTIGNPYTGTISGTLTWYADNYPNGIIYAQNITIASGASLTISPGQYNGCHLQFAHATTLTINSGGSFTINPQTSVTVDNIVNNGSLTLESYPNESGVASLYHSNYSGAGTTVTRLYLSGGTTAEGNYKWHYISVPVNNVSATSFSTLDLAQYIENLVVNEENESGWVAYDGYRYSTELITGPTFSTLELGKGYNYYSASGSTFSLSGNLNVQGIEVPVTCGTGYPNSQGFNLLGNPFASCIDWDYIIANHTPISVNNAIYFTVNGKVAAYVGGIGIDGGTGTIPPLQGFFVHTTANSDVYMPPEARTHNLDQYRYKKGTKETTEKKDTFSFVRIQLKNSIDSTDLVVRFSKNASPVYDKELDAYKFSKNAGDINIWSTIDDIDYSINAIPFPESKVDVALGIKVVKGGTYKLCSNELKRLDNYSITLRDLSTNTSIDLKKGEIFTFEAPAGITENRFILSIANQTTDIPVITTNKRKFHIYASYGSLNILSLSDEYGNLPCSVTVYELTGRKIFQVNNLEWNGNGDLKQFAVDPAENGLLIVEVRAGNKKYVEKIKFNR